jgi:methyl-accepting chemotaxis protein/ligand-binding sensor domain-containing protein
MKSFRTGVLVQGSVTKQSPVKTRLSAVSACGSPMKRAGRRPLDRSGRIALTSSLLAVWLSFCPASAQTPFFQFEPIGTREGLSMANVMAIAEDAYGFMWFGTEDGLNRFDGYQFTVYRSSANDTGTINNSYVSALLLDSRKRLWIGTRDGLCRYVPEKDAFIRYPTGSDDPGKPNNRDIKSLFEDSKGGLWVIGDAGADRLSPEDGTFRHYMNDPKNPFSLSYNTAYTATETRDGRIWIGTEKGLNRMNPNTGRCERIFSKGRGTNSLCSDYIRILHPDGNDGLWVGTYGGGLDYFDIRSNRFIHFPFGPSGSRSLSNDQVNSIAPHWDGNLWVGTTEGLNFIRLDRRNLENSIVYRYLEDPDTPGSLTAGHIQHIWSDSCRVWMATRFGGINRIDRYGSKFRKFTRTAAKGRGINYPNVSCFAEDDQGRVYIGSDGGGVSIMDPRTGRFEYLTQSSGGRSALASNKVLALQFQPPNTLWIGMWNGGLDRYRIDTRTAVHYRTRASDRGSLSSDNVFSLLLDRDRRVWVGTWSGGLNRYDPATDRFIRYPFNATDGTGTSGQTVMQLRQDADGALWLATEGQGLNRLDPGTGRFTYYRSSKDDTASLSGDYVYGILQDRRKRIWLATTNGLCCLPRKNSRFIRFHGNHGLPSETLYGILEDGRGDLWVSSIKGLSRIVLGGAADRPTIRCTNYTTRDGLQGEQFGQWAYFKDRSGNMYFGGVNGFNRFNPLDIRINPVSPRVLINDFQLSFKSCSFLDPSSPLKKPAYLSDAVTVSYRESMMTFGFVGIGYTRAEDNRYAYKLENFDRQWLEVGTDRRATYTNLNPGRYTFRVRAANNDGVWNETGAAMQLTITPPFWRRVWFILLMTLAGLASAAALYKWRIRSMEAHRERLETEIAQRTAEIQSKTEEIEASYKRLSETGQTLASLSVQVNRATARINDTMNRVNAGAESQNETVGRTRDLVSGLLSSIAAVTSQTRISARTATETVHAVQTGTASMSTTLDAMQSIEKNVSDTWELMRELIAHSERIDGIVQLVDDIASRVNVLALNALIEAVRAGENGRGFMVVAQEIRDLSRRTADSIQEITDAVLEIQNDVKTIEGFTRSGIERVKDSARITNEGRAVLDRICRSVEDEKKRISSIAERVGEMQNASYEVQKAIESVESVSRQSQENVAQVKERTDEVGLRIQELASLAQTLANR